MNWERTEFKRAQIFGRKVWRQREKRDSNMQGLRGYLHIERIQEKERGREIGLVREREIGISEVR